MGLPTPGEPKNIKELVKIVRMRLGGGSPDIDYDSLSVWSFNELPKYLWEAWKAELKERGITWQKFLRILSLHTIDLVEWGVYDRLEWTELIKRIEATIENYSKKSQH